MPSRPLSPHLSVYRMSRYTLTTSIFNRITGVGLSLGVVLLVWWLMAVAGGAAAQARAQQLLGHPLMRLVYAALIIAFCYHLVAGLRHLVWDTGRGLERAQSQRSARLVVITSLVLSVAIALAVWRLKLQAP